MLDVLDHDRTTLSRDPSRESAADRDRHALAHLLLDATSSPRHQHAAILIDHQDRGRVGLNRDLDPIQQLAEQLLKRHVRQRRISDPLKRPPTILNLGHRRHHRTLPATLAS